MISCMFLGALPEVETQHGCQRRCRKVLTENVRVYEESRIEMNFRDAYNPTRGVKEDFSKLLETFSTRKTVRYEDFAELWRSMKFSYLYAGRKNDRECREVCTKHFMKSSFTC